jgi:hypothetical protein
LSSAFTLLSTAEQASTDPALESSSLSHDSSSALLPLPETGIESSSIDTPVSPQPDTQTPIMELKTLPSPTREARAEVNIIIQFS